MRFKQAQTSLELVLSRPDVGSAMNSGEERKISYNTNSKAKIKLGTLDDIAAGTTAVAISLSLTFEMPF